jgi:hypothetical protein
LAGVEACCLAPVCAEDALYRAAVHGTVVSISPPALVRDGHLFVPLEFVTHSLGANLVARPGSPERELDFFDHWARWAVGKTDLQTAEGNWALPAAPFADQGTVYVPAELIAEGLGVTLTVAQGASEAPLVVVSSSGARMGNLSLQELPDKLRLSVPLDGETVYQWRNLGDSVEINLPLPASELSPTPGFTLECFRNPHLTEVSRTVSVQGFTRLDLGVQEVGEPSVSALSDPPRLVIDLPLLAPRQGLPGGTAGPAPGLQTLPAPARPVLPPGAPTWDLRHFLTARGPMEVYVLQLAANDPKWRARPALADDTVHTRHSVAYISRQCGAVAAINGGFFATQGPPVGMLVIDGEWITTPLLNRTILAAGASGQLRMGRWAFCGHVDFPGHGALAITDINRNQGDQDELIVYTQRWANTLPGDPLSVRLAISAQGVVTVRETQGRVIDVPDHGYLLSARGRQAQALSSVAVGDICHVEMGTDPAWPELRWAVEGGPRLLVDGQIDISAPEECFRADVCEGTASRSAAGITQSGDLLLVAVESPGTGYGGVTLHELAEIMQKLGAYQAMNLDGGGSTTVAAGGETINRVRGDARLVSNALVVVPR